MSRSSFVCANMKSFQHNIIVVIVTEPLNNKLNQKQNTKEGKIKHQICEWLKGCKIYMNEELSHVYSLVVEEILLQRITIFGRQGRLNSNFHFLKVGHTGHFSLGDCFILFCLGLVCGSLHVLFGRECFCVTLSQFCPLELLSATTIHSTVLYCRQCILYIPLQIKENIP